MGVVKKKPKTKRPKLGEGSIITPYMIEKYGKKQKLGKPTLTEIRKMMREEERRRRLKLKQAAQERLIKGRKKKQQKQQSTRGYA